LRPPAAIRSCYDDKSGHAIFEYDLQSSLSGPFGDERITESGRKLDVELAALLDAASAP
jgi:hypothetical protein